MASTKPTATRKRYRVLADAVSDSVEPGFILLGRLRGRSPVTAGMGGATVLVLYRSEETVMNGALLADLKVHKAIEGREHQWLRDVVPPYFPKVRCLEQRLS